MHDGLRAFAAELIDDAAMFPPAELPLEQAIRQDLRYRDEPDAWMLGRFICPAARLADLLQAEPRRLSEVPRFRISALGRGGSDSAACLDGLQSDLAIFSEFHRQLGRTGVVEVLELRVPADISDGSAEDWSAFLRRASATIVESGLPELRLYCEVTSPRDPARANERAARALGSFAAATGAATGLKVRCGGVIAEAFPSVELVARALAACREAGTSFKATAGLHHPIRTYRAEVQTRMHGFVNVFGAALLAFEHGLAADRIRPILATEEAADFRFDQDGFAWRDLRVSSERIRELRRRAVTSFGSCSFEEPREDLRALGWLPPDPHDQGDPR